jgi:hypothetical protein
MENDNNTNQIHLHIHEGATPAAARAAAEGLRSRETHIPEPSGGGEELVLPAADRTAEYIKRAYTESEGKAKPLLEFLADNPERPIPYPEVSKHLGFPTARSLPGLLGSFSRRADHRYEGLQPFEKRWLHDGWHLLMSSENAAIVNELR